MKLKTYENPELKIYSGDPAINKTIQLISESTDQEIHNIFSNWINGTEHMKKCMDVADLMVIKKDIDKHNESLNILPKLDSYTELLSMVDMFINITEEKAGRRLNYDDFFNIPWICDYINIIQPTKKYKNKISKEKKFKDIWFRNIITTIRNWLMHNNYIIKRNGVYIHSKDAYKKKTDKKDTDWNYIMEDQAFEAMISYGFFIKLIYFCTQADRKLKISGFEIKNIDRKKWFEKNKNLIKIWTNEWTKKWNIYKSISDAFSSIKDWDAGLQIRSLSNWQEKFLWEYFKTHEFNRRNLEFINKFMAYDDNRIQLNAIFGNNTTILDRMNYFKSWAGDNDISKCMIEWFTEWSNIDNWKIWWTDQDIENEVKRKFTRIKALPYQIYLEYNNPEAKKYILNPEFMVLNEILPKKIKEAVIWLIKALKYTLLVIKDLYLTSNIQEYRKNYLKALFLSKFYVNNPKLGLAQPQKRKWDKLWRQWYNYIMNKCKENPEFYWSKEIKHNHIDKILWNSYREFIFRELTRWNVDNWIIKDTNDVDQLMNEINLFSTKNAKHLTQNQKQILKYNVRKVIAEWKEKLDTVTLIWEEEHVRNAFAHHNYTIVPWFDKILLWDPSRNDNPDWEKVYDLDELYQNCVNRVDECFLDKETSD